MTIRDDIDDDDYDNWWLTMTMMMTTMTMTTDEWLWQLMIDYDNDDDDDDYDNWWLTMTMMTIHDDVDDNNYRVAKIKWEYGPLRLCDCWFNAFELYLFILLRTLHNVIWRNMCVIVCFV